MKQATRKYRLLKTRNADNFDIETKISYIFLFFSSNNPIDNSINIGSLFEMIICPFDD